MKIKLKIEKCMKNGLHVRLNPGIPIGIAIFRLEILISDRHFGLPIGKPKFRSEFWIFDRKSSFLI